MGTPKAATATPKVKIENAVVTMDYQLKEMRKKVIENRAVTIHEIDALLANVGNIGYWNTLDPNKVIPA